MALIFRGGGFIPPAIAGGLVVLDAVGTVTQHTTTYTGMTVGSGLVGGALVIVINTATAQTVTSVPVWGSQTMTLIGSVNLGNVGVTGATTYMYGLLNPQSGNQTVTYALTGNNASVCGISFSGVNSVFGTAFQHYNSNGAIASSISTSIVSATNHMVLGVAGDPQNSINTISGTQKWLSNAFIVDTAGCINPGAASVNVSATFSAADQVGVAGVDISF
jgi:hypothetical protein